MSPRLLEGGGEEARQDTRRGEEGGSNLMNLHHLRSLSHFCTGYIKVKEASERFGDPAFLDSLVFTDR